MPDDFGLNRGALLRSLLFVPADNERKLAKSLTSGADCLILDLEDSVAEANKPKARLQAADFLATAAAQSPRPHLYVRINGLGTDLAEADLAAVMRAAPDGIMLPKCLNGASVQHLGAMLAVKEAEHDLADGATRIIAIATETAASLFGLASYANASPRLRGLAWGAEDLCASAGAETARRADGSYTFPFALARSLALFAAAAAQALPIDTVHLDYRDPAALRRECELARRDGFAAKMAIHPAQVPIINEAFTPSRESIERARAIIAAFEAQPDAGVISFEGEMLDRPHLARARRILAKALKF
jgi:citrate lyase subunit beta/citryl-CoA lyase